MDPKKLSAKQMMDEFDAKTPAIVFKVKYSLDVEADFPRKQDTYHTKGSFVLPIPVDCTPDETGARDITVNKTAFRMFCPGNGFGTSEMLTSFLVRNARGAPSCRRSPFIHISPSCRHLAI
jgi:hypothetical protein